MNHFVWTTYYRTTYEGVSKIFWNGLLEREFLMVQLSATRCSCIAILWVSLLTFAAITLCVASQQVFIIVYFVIDSVQRLLDTSSYVCDPRSMLQILWSWLISRRFAVLLYNGTGLFHGSYFGGLNCRASDVFSIEDVKTDKSHENVT
jgi:hypothetical protein